MHQTLRRARRWLECEQIPVDIIEQDGFYSLAVRGGAAFSFRVPLEHADVSGLGAQWQRLRAFYPESSEFQPKAARERLGLPRSTFQRFMRWAVAEGKVARLGDNNSIHYRILSAQPSSEKKAA